MPHNGLSRLRSLLAESAPRNLIVDLRFNTGGTTRNYPEFLRSVVGFVVVGEASSECCNFFGDAATVRLPYSGVTGAVTGARWNRSKDVDVFDARREMSPHVPVQLTAADWLAGRDPTLEAIFRIIGAQSVGGNQNGWGPVR